jgi:hypothetical protein
MLPFLRKERAVCMLLTRNGQPAHSDKRCASLPPSAAPFRAPGPARTRTGPIITNSRPPEKDSSPWIHILLSRSESSAPRHLQATFVRTSAAAHAGSLQPTRVHRFSSGASISTQAGESRARGLRSDGSQTPGRGITGCPRRTQRRS